jgi:hypothetical protein
MLSGFTYLLYLSFYPILKGVGYFCFSRLWNPALGALEGLG